MTAPTCPGALGGRRSRRGRSRRHHPYIPVAPGWKISNPHYRISGIPAILRNVETVRLGKKGQVSIPRGILRKLGLAGDELLVVDTTPDGGILLRPAGVYPIEIYSEQRVNEFQRDDRMTARETAWVRKKLRRAT
jgi:AbrB family looped-hinge helix DNA binding protein